MADSIGCRRGEDGDSSIMLKLALTGRELAELYALEAMGVPPSTQDQLEGDDPAPAASSYLVDSSDDHIVLHAHQHLGPSGTMCS